MRDLIAILFSKCTWNVLKVYLPFFSLLKAKENKRLLPELLVHWTKLMRWKSTPQRHFSIDLTSGKFEFSIKNSFKQKALQNHYPRPADCKTAFVDHWDLTALSRFAFPLPWWRALRHENANSRQLCMHQLSFASKALPEVSAFFWSCFSSSAQKIISHTKPWRTITWFITSRALNLTNKLNYCFKKSN